MDERERDLERFGEAVEQKKREAKEASEAGPDDLQPSGSAVQDDGPQGSRVESGRTQDEFSPRAKNAGKGKKTADKWNQ